MCMCVFGCVRQGRGGVNAEITELSPQIRKKDYTSMAYSAILLLYIPLVAS